jgi:GTP cyclohydrolase III
MRHSLVSRTTQDRPDAQDTGAARTEDRAEQLVHRTQNNTNTYTHTQIHLDTNELTRRRSAPQST